MILLSSPNISGNEWKYIKDCLDTEWVSSVGSYVDKFEKSLSDFTKSKFSIATSSGTSALHISLILSNIKENDYVIVPNITFVASLNSISYVGAKPILIDIDKRTWQMDLKLLIQFLEINTKMLNGKCYLKKNNKRIKAIMPVHVLGNILDMEKLVDICKNFNLKIIEDSTEALGSYYNNKHAGTFGTFGTFSFNGNKIITTGGGGMIITNDEYLAKKAKHLSTQAKSDSFEYFHDLIGYNYRLTNIAAAMGLAQMEKIDSFIKRKHYIKNFYIKRLKNLGDIEFQKLEKNSNPNWWLFTIKTNKKNELLKVLNKNNIQARPFWVPMNNLPMFKNEIYISNNDYSKNIYDSCISLPCSTNILDKELEKICELIKSYFV